MTDVLTTEDLFVTSLVSKWNTNKELIDDLDESLKSESLGKTKLLNASVKAAEEAGEAQPVVSAVNEILSRLDGNPEVFVGVLTAIRRALKVHDKTLNDYVEENVVEVPEDQKLDIEAETKAREDRKKAVDSNNAIRGLLEAQSPEWFTSQGDAMLPKLDNMRGAPGKRGETGKRIVGTFQWMVEDTLIQAHQMGAVAKYLNTQVKDIRTAIEEQITGFDWENPPASFNFTFKGKPVSAKRIDDDTPDENGEDEDLSVEVDEDPDADPFADS